MPPVVPKSPGVYNPAKHRFMMSQRQFYTAAPGCGKTHHLALAAQAQILAGIPVHRLLALTVHPPAAQALRDMLVEKTGQAVPTTTLRRRALTLLQEHPRAAGLPEGWDETALLSGIDRRWLIRRAWIKAGDAPHSLYWRRAEQPGALDWVSILFDHFSDWCGTAEPQNLPPIAPHDARLDELWRAYQGYLRLCYEHGVVAFGEVFGRAADALRKLTHESSYGPAVLLLDDLDLFKPAELLFVEQLIGPQTSVFAASATAFDPASPLAHDHFVQRWCSALGFQATASESVDVLRPTLRFAEYPSPDDEVHAVAQRIAAEHGRDNVAVVPFDHELAKLLQRTLPQYGVPIEGEEPRDGYTLALAPLALAGLRLLAGHALTIAETIGLLRDPALGLSPADAQVVVDATERLHFQPLSLGAATGAMRWPETLSLEGQLCLQTIRAVSENIRQAGELPSVQLQRWLSELGIEERAWARTRAALEPWAVTVDRQHWTRLLGFLKQSEALRAALGEPLPASEAVEVWTSAQALVQAHGKPHGHAVRIWQPAELGGCSADVVFAIGLHEGALPAPVQPLPLVDDAALAATFADLPGFVPPQAHDRAAGWLRGHRLLERTVGRARSVVYLSYSAADRQGRSRLPSLILAAYVEAHSDQRGRLQVGAELTALADVPTEVLRRPKEYAATALLPTAAPLEHTTVRGTASPFFVTPSAIEDYFNCPRRCFYARQLHLYDVASSPRQALGNVVHDALHELLQEARHLGPSEARARQLIAKHWIHEEQRWGSRLKQTVFRQLAEQAATQMARYESDQGNGAAAYLAGEVTFRWTLPGTDVTVTGRIDRIDRTPDGLHVIDYKLGKHSPSISDLLHEFIRPPDADDTWRPSDIQLPIYALAVEQGELAGLERLPGERVRSAGQIYPLELYTATGRVSTKGRRIIELVEHASGCAVCEPPSSGKPSQLCRAQLAAVEADVRAAVELMRAGEWEPQPREGSQTCASCTFRPICLAPQ